MFGLGGKREILGVDIGSSSVKLVQLQPVRSGYKLAALGSAPLPPEAVVDHTIMDAGAVVEALKGLLTNQKIQAKHVATAVRGHAVIVRKIQLPQMEEDELESSIQWEAEQYIPFDIAEVYLDYQLLGPVEGDPNQMEAVLVAAKRDFVDDYLSVFVETGLETAVVDVDCYALESAFEANYGVPEETVALVDIGASSFSVNILKSGISAFTRDIQTGGDAYNEELQRRLGLSQEEAETIKLGGDLPAGVEETAFQEAMAATSSHIAQEVRRCLDYFAATSADEHVDRAYVTGGVSLYAPLLEAIQDELGIPVERLDPFAAVEINDKQFDVQYVQGMAPICAVALGLATRRPGDQ